MATILFAINTIDDKYSKNNQNVRYVFQKRNWESVYKNTDKKSVSNLSKNTKPL